MKALRYLGPRRIRVEDVEEPRPGPGEVLVRVTACGVCATDAKTYLRGHPRIRPGTVLGHEIAGTVEWADGEARWKAGDRVVVAPYVPCAECPACRRGRPTLCARLFEVAPDPGGFAELIRVPERIAGRGLLRIPSGTSFAEASFTEPLASCVHAVELLGLRPGDSVLVMGDGPMGLLQAQLARIHGANPVIVSGMRPARLRAAETFADVVLDAGRTQVISSVREVAPDGVDHVLVSAGETGVVQQAMALVAPGGKVNLFAGLPHGTDLVVPADRIHYEEVTLLGSFGSSPVHLGRALDLIARGEVEVASLITASFPLPAAESALQAVVEQRGIKTIVVADGGRERMHG